MSKRAMGAFLTIFGGACWGVSGSVGQYLFTRQGMDSRWLVPIRLGLAGILLFLYCLVRYRSQLFAPWKSRRNAVDLLIYGVAGVSVCQFLYFLTIQLSSAGTATILQDLSPIMILLCGCVSARRFPRAFEWVSIVLALSGVLLLTTHGSLGSFAVSPAALLTGVLSAVCVTIYNVEPKRLLRQFPVAVLQAWAFLMGGVLFSLAFRPWSFGYVPNFKGLLGIVFVVVVGNILAFMSFMSGVKLIGPERSILYGFSEPITAALISTLVLGSSFTLWDAVGFAAVFAMLVLISAAPQADAKTISSTAV
ncbi:MAG: DMT family transporter [Oscillospiraceae bacterium]|jgi:drug/metabolite transporter (DMT)-like permease|nr:DMT family transporter [Oscillospiraceae bacterium]MDD3260820.1 DMT family transporter [Oscillospiraceae bacterium]